MNPKYDLLIRKIDHQFSAVDSNTMTDEEYTFKDTEKIR